MAFPNLTLTVYAMRSPTGHTVTNYHLKTVKSRYPFSYSHGLSLTVTDCCTQSSSFFYLQIPKAFSLSLSLHSNVIPQCRLYHGDFSLSMTNQTSHSHLPHLHFEASRDRRRSSTPPIMSPSLYAHPPANRPPPRHPPPRSPWKTPSPIPTRPAARSS